MKLIDIINASNENMQISIVMDFQGMQFVSPPHFTPYFLDRVEDKNLEARVIELLAKDNMLFVLIEMNEAEQKGAAE